MAKFIAAQLTYKQESDQDALQNFTSKELKKTFKCKKVEELKYCNKSVAKVAKSTGIAAYELNQLIRKLTSTDLDDMKKNRYRSDKETKIFVLSDDASQTAIAFNVLKNEFTIKFFKLDDSEVSDCIESLEIIQSADDSISSLNEAKELCESLNEIESDLGLSLVYHSAIDEIDEKISDIESDLERSREAVAEIFEAQWS
jgi:hypothetical protein